MKLLAPFVLGVMLSGNECPNSTPVGSWKIAHHEVDQNGSLMRTELSEREKDRILIMDQCQNFWIIQATDTLEHGRWKLNKKGNKLSIKYLFSSTKALKSGASQRTPLCFVDSITIGEDLPEREYAEQYGYRQSTYYRIKE